MLLNAELLTRKLLFVVSITTIFWGCNQISQKHNPTISVDDKVEVNRNSNHFQFTGTRIFMTIPASYNFIPSLIRYQKDENTYIQVIETQSVGYTARKSSIIRGFDSLKSAGLVTYYQKEFKLGEYDALIMYGPDNVKPGEEQIVMFFGDDSFFVMAAGELPGGDEKARNEILNSLLTAYVDKAVTPDMTALANYTVDVSKSEFKYTANISQMFFYTVDGKGNPGNPSENEFFIMTLPSMHSIDKLKSYAESLINGTKNNGTIITSTEENEIQINGVPSVEIKFSGNFKGKAFKGYEVVLGSDKGSIVFTGIAFDRPEELIKEFVSVSQTLKFK